MLKAGTQILNCCPRERSVMRFSVHRGPGTNGTEYESDYDSLSSTPISDDEQEEDENKESSIPLENDKWLEDFVSSNWRDAPPRLLRPLSATNAKSSTKATGTGSPMSTRHGNNNNADAIKEYQDSLSSLGAFLKAFDLNAEIKRQALNQADSESLHQTTTALKSRQDKILNSQRAARHQRQQSRHESLEKAVELARQQEQERIEQERKRQEKLQREEEERLRKIALEKEERERRAKQEQQDAERQRQQKQEAEKQRIEAERIQQENTVKLQRIKQERLEKEKKQAALAAQEPAVEKEFRYYQDIIQKIKKDIVEAVKNNPSHKKFCFDGRRKITPKLGQLTISRQQLVRIVSELGAVFQAAQQYDETCYKWLLNFFAKALVRQAATETVASPVTATALGILAISMMVKHSELKELLLGRFVKKCPFVIGYNGEIDTEQGRKDMGWKRTSEGRWEEDSSYSERMGAICGVWAVMTRVKFGLNSQVPHPYPIWHSWVFLARMLNTDIKHLENAHFATVAMWWDMASKSFTQVYKSQAIKLLRLIIDKWVPSVRDKRLPSATRLSLLGDEWKKEGKLGKLDLQLEA